MEFARYTVDVIQVDFFTYSSDESLLIRRSPFCLGELFIRMVKMILIPLVVTSVISSIAQINANVIGSLGVRVMSCITACFSHSSTEVVVWLKICDRARC